MSGRKRISRSLAAVTAVGLGASGTLWGGTAAYADTASNARLSYVQNGNLYLANADGSSPTLLASGGISDTPRWSADGSQVEYVQNGNVFIGSASGTVIKQLTTDNQASHTFYAENEFAYEDNGSLFRVNELGGLFGVQSYGIRNASPVSDAGTGYTLYYLDASGQLTTDGGTVVGPGIQMADPELSPDDTRIAFVDPATGQLVIRAFDNQGGLTAAVTVTKDGSADSDPQWSQDGTTLTYESGGNVLRVNAPANGATSVTPVTGSLVITGAGGAVPVNLTAKFVVREWGSNALNTAIAVSQRNYLAAGTSSSASDRRMVADCVVLTRSDQFYDALTGSALARSEDCPLLLVPHTGMTSTVMAEIQRVLPLGSTVYVLGGYAALPQSVDEAIDAAGYPVTRFAGSNMYDTAVKVDRHMAPSQPFLVMVATGSSYYDALAAAPQVASAHAPLVLSTGGVSNASLSPASLAYLNSINPVMSGGGVVTMYTVGGPAQAAVRKALAAGQLPAWAAAPSYAVQDLVGSNAEETALAIAHNFQYGGLNGIAHVGVATVSDWHDALAGGATVNMMLLTTPNQLYPGDAAYLGASSQAFHEVDVFGGTAALSDAVPNGITPLIGSPEVTQYLQVTPGNVPPILLTQGVLNMAAQPNLSRTRANVHGR